MCIRTQGKEQSPHRTLNQTYLLVLEGLLQRRGWWLWLTLRTRTVEAEVLGSTPWHEPSQSLPLPPPKKAGRLQSWVASGQTINREGTQPHPSVDKWIKVLLSSAQQSKSQLYPPPLPPIRKLAHTRLLDSLVHQRADSRSKKNYNPAACGTKTTFKKDRQDQKAEGHVPDEGTR